LARSGILLEFWTSGDPMGAAQGKVPGMGPRTRNSGVSGGIDQCRFPTPWGLGILAGIFIANH